MPGMILLNQMKKISKYILIITMLVGLFSPVSKTEAISCTAPNTPPGCIPPYQLLAPLPGVGDASNKIDTGQTDSTGKNVALGSYLNAMIKIIIGLAAVLSVVMIVIGGMEYITSELPGNKEAGKERVRGALLGLLIALGAYALLNTINPDLLTSDVDIPSATVTVDLEADVPQAYDPVTKKYKNGVAFRTPLTGTPATLPPFVTLNAAQCTTVGQTNCTSTIGLNTSQVLAIQWGCGCPLIITGGTEWWLHGGQTGSTSHQVNNSTVDLRAGDPKLDNYLSGGQPLVAGRRYSSPAGSALYEGNHWHIGP